MSGNRLADDWHQNAGEYEDGVVDRMNVDLLELLILIALVLMSGAYIFALTKL